MSRVLMLSPEAKPPRFRRGEALHAPPQRSGKERGHSCPRRTRPPQRQECRCSLCCRQRRSPLCCRPRRSLTRSRRSEAVRSGDILVPECFGTSPASDRNVAAPYAPARSEAVRSGDIPVPVGHVHPSDRNVAAPYAVARGEAPHAAARGEAPHAPPRRSSKERGHFCPRRARPPPATGMSLLLMLPPEAEPLTLRRSEALHAPAAAKR